MDVESIDIESIDTLRTSTSSWIIHEFVDVDSTDIESSSWM